MIWMWIGCVRSVQVVPHTMCVWMCHVQRTEFMRKLLNWNVKRQPYATLFIWRARKTFFHFFKRLLLFLGVDRTECGKATDVEVDFQMRKQSQNETENRMSQTMKTETKKKKEEKTSSEKGKKRKQIKSKQSKTSGKTSKSYD